MKRRLLATALVASWVLLTTAISIAAVAQKMNYQAVLTSNNQPVISPVVVVFTIYDAASGGASVWSETRTITPDANGRVNLRLGETNPITEAVFSGADRWLGVKIASDAEMSPRTPLASSSYSFKVATVDGAKGGQVSGDLVVKSAAAALETESVSTAQARVVLVNDIGDSVVIGPADQVVLKAISHTGEQALSATIDPVKGGVLAIGVDGKAIAEHTATTSTYSVSTGAGKSLTAQAKVMQVGSDGFFIYNPLTGAILAQVNATSGAVQAGGLDIRRPGSVAADKLGGDAVCPGITHNANTDAGNNSLQAPNDLTYATNSFIVGTCNRVGWSDDITSNTTLIGEQNLSRGNQTFAVGLSDTTYADNSVAIGTRNVTGYAATGTIVLGDSNFAGGSNSLVAGFGHKVQSNEATVLGDSNYTLGQANVSCFGENDSILNSSWAAILGGHMNKLDQSSDALIGGGVRNHLQLAGISAILSGSDNLIKGSSQSLINGGIGNRISTDDDSGLGFVAATIGGGVDNVASNSFATVGGGQYNNARSMHSTVGGGSSNWATNYQATVAGGIGNLAAGVQSFVGGGIWDTAQGIGAVAAGGYGNAATGGMSAIGGGHHNQATGDYSTVSGGYGNAVTGGKSAIGGGYQNRAAGEYSAVPGGHANFAEGLNSFATGSRAHAAHSGTFVWSDLSADADFASTAANQFLIRSAGNVGINTNSPSQPLTVAGTVYSTSGGFKFPDGSVQSSAAASVSDGWTDDGTNVRLSNSTDNVGVGTATPSEKLEVNGNLKVSGTITSGTATITMDGPGEQLKLGSDINNQLVLKSNGTGLRMSKAGTDVIALDANGPAGKLTVRNSAVPNEWTSFGPNSTVFDHVQNGVSRMKADVGPSGAKLSMNNSAGVQVFSAFAVADNTAAVVLTSSVLPGDSLKVGPDSTVFDRIVGGVSRMWARMTGAGPQMAMCSSTGAKLIEMTGSNSPSTAYRNSPGPDSCRISSQQLVLGSSGRIEIDAGQLTYYNSSGNRVATISGNGNVTLCNSSGSEKLRLDATGMNFDSSGATAYQQAAPGGTKIYSNLAHTSGVQLAAGGSAWSSVSDRNAKENVRSVDGDRLLERLSDIQVATWNYKSQDQSIRHIGPMAQDFHTAFGVGEDDKHITTIDADGVALAAIQALYKKTQQLGAQQTEIEQLKAQVTELQELIRQLAANKK